MSTGVPKHQLDSDLSKALYIHGLDAVLENDSRDYSSDDKVS